MRANPNRHWNRLFEKIRLNERFQATSTESDFPLVLIVREFSLENVRRKLLSRCAMFRRLGISLCLASVVSLLMGYPILSMGFILLGSGITLFSEIWKRYLPKPTHAEQNGLTTNKSDLTNKTLAPMPAILPLLSQEQKQDAGSFVSSASAVEIEQFFNSCAYSTNRL